ncbi:TolC family outer membrane protein [Sphingomonas carotinifaciens]|uniref:TolC family outer membrane protein n=1 Tax=Sphingomonas carotinifaciens TaxID=1166323 RepID=UPI000DD644FA|nr:TolC family outer membrane protein [Sphingomonas carotinifaciens]
MRLRPVRLLLIGAAIVPCVPASADTLREALLKAYQGNPTITGQRAQQRATDENVPIARAGALPTVNATGQLTEFVVQANNNFVNPTRQGVANVQLSVPIYQGGAVKNGLRAAETRVDAGRATLRSTEAQIFTSVVSAYMNVIRDEAVVGLNTQNVRVLETNLRASRDRFEVGDLTRTDVAQSEARLAQARAQLQSAEAQLIASREDYINVVGSPPDRLEQPPSLPNLPDAPSTAVSVALESNPQLLAARRNADATRFDIGVARANRLPRLNAVTSGSYFNYLDSLTDQAVRAGIPGSGKNVNAGLQLNVPLFQGGRPAAQVRQAEALRAQAIENVTATERQVIAQARSAYAQWQASRQVIASSEAAVSANTLSLEGVRAENSVGTRTVIEILNAEQELLNSQVQLVTARRDAYVAGFALLAAMGNAEARDLGLDGGVLYDPVINYRRVRNRINDWGGDGEPMPVAVSTANTPAQTAVVTRPLDSTVDRPVDRSPALTTGAESPNRQ